MEKNALPFEKVAQNNFLGIAEYSSASFEALSHGTKTRRGMLVALWESHLRCVNQGSFENVLYTIIKNNFPVLMDSLAPMITEINDNERENSISSISLVTGGPTNISLGMYMETVERQLKDFETEAELSRQGADVKNGRLWQAPADLGQRCIEIVRTLFHNEALVSALSAMDTKKRARAVTILCSWIENVAQLIPPLAGNKNKDNTIVTSFAGFEALSEVRHTLRKGCLRVLHDAGALPEAILPELLVELKVLSSKWKEVKLLNDAPNGNNQTERLQLNFMWDYMQRLRQQSAVLLETRSDIADTLAYATRSTILGAIPEQHQEAQQYEVLPPSTRIMEIRNETADATRTLFCYDGYAQWAAYGVQHSGESPLRMQLADWDIHPPTDMFHSTIQSTSGVFVFPDGRLSLNIPGRTLGLLPDATDHTELAHRLWSNASRPLETLMNTVPDLFEKKNNPDASLVIHSEGRIRIVTTAETLYADPAPENPKDILEHYNILTLKHDGLRTYEKKTATLPLMTQPPEVNMEDAFNAEDIQTKDLPRLQAGEVLRRLKSMGMQTRQNGSSHVIFTNPHTKLTTLIGMNQVSFHKKSEPVPAANVVSILRRLGISIADFFPEVEHESRNGLRA